MLFIRYSLLAQWREHYPRKWYLLHSFVSALLSLWVYKMTSKAIGDGIMSSGDWGGLDYFSFVVVGELSLLLPLAVLESMSRGVRYAHLSGFLDQILLQSSKPWKKLVGLSWGTLLRDLMDLFLQLCLALMVFDLQLGLDTVFSYLFYMLVSLPNFFLLGALAALMILITGRGGGIIGQGLFLLSVLSGVYFPTTAFPAWVQNFVVDFLPTAYIADSIRSGTIQLLPDVFYWCGSGIFLAVLFRYASAFSLKLRASQDRVDVPLF